jgi:hypothetical protein
MRRITVFAIAVIAVLALLPGSSLAATKLTGTVGPGYTISLRLGNKVVTSLRRGAYTIVVSDRSSMHDFHLRGPGVNRATSVRGIGTVTWYVTFRAGTYTYLCDPHPSKMTRRFVVR